MSIREFFEIRIIIRDGSPEVTLYYDGGVMAKGPVRHTYDRDTSLEILDAIKPWVPESLSDKNESKI